MRIISYFLLLFSFTSGIAAAFLFAYLFYWNKPQTVAVTSTSPETGIIIATQDVPQGAFLEASLIRFIPAPIDQIPDNTITSFSAASGRRTLYAIPAGCPICEEMLASPIAAKNEQSVFVPLGYRIVPIHVERVRGFNTTIAPGERTNISVLPHRKPGRFDEMKEQVLGLNDENRKKIVLENVTVYSVQTTVGHESTTLQPQEISVLLTSAQHESLLASSREGLLCLTPLTPAFPERAAQPEQQLAVKPKTNVKAETPRKNDSPVTENRADSKAEAPGNSVRDTLSSVSAPQPLRAVALEAGEQPTCLLFAEASVPAPQNTGQASESIGRNNGESPLRNTVTFVTPKQTKRFASAVSVEPVATVRPVSATNTVNMTVAEPAAKAAKQGPYSPWGMNR